MKSGIRENNSDCLPTASEWHGFFSLSSRKQYAIMIHVKTCYKCHHALTISRNIGRKDVCPSCGVDLHCCLNCEFYDRVASKQCREPVAELVKDKERANFCDFFAFAETRVTGGPGPDAERARKSLDDLFKK
jgi:hypothetical protein